MKVFKRILALLLVLALLAGAAWCVWRFLLRDGSTWQSLAQQLESSGRYAWAERCYRWAWSREPYSTALPIALARCYESSGNYTKCEATLWDAIERMPGEAAFYMELSRVYVAQNKLLDASQLADQITHPDARAAFLAARPEAPVIQPDGGEYDHDCTVSLSYASGEAYWTLNGDYPSLDTDAYTAPVQLESREATVLALIVGQNGLVSAPATAHFVVGFVDEPVTIADPALDALLRQTMSWVDTVQLTTGLLAQVETLTLTADVTDLSQLALLTGLRSLDATALTVGADWSCLAGLTQLETLLLPPDTLSTSSLQTIGSLTGLKTLSLAGCGLTSLAPLESLTALEELDLTGGSIGDCAVLARMPSLRVLRLGGNAVTSTAPLSGLTRLQELDLHENPLGNLSPLRSLRELRVLNVASTGIDGLDALADMTKLEELDASDNQIAAINVLSGLTLLSRVNLSHNAITAADALAGLKYLFRLDLSYNQLAALPSFSDQCTLTFFDASHNQLTAVTGLENLPQINYVYLDYNQIEDLLPLTSCFTLVQVDAFENPTRVAQALIDMGVIVHYTPVFDEETGHNTSVDPGEAAPEESDAPDSAG